MDFSIFIHFVPFITSIDFIGIGTYDHLRGIRYGIIFSDTKLQINIPIGANKIYEYLRENRIIFFFTIISILPLVWFKAPSKKNCP